MERRSGRLAGRRAAVTGGTSGIGLGVVDRFVAEGADVTAIARRYRPEVDDVGARFVAADVADPEQMRAAFDAIAEDGALLDVLVLNAGVAPLDAPTLEATDLAEAEHALRVNTLGVLHGLAIAPRYLADGASVIVTGSAATSWAFPGYMAYSMSKAPLHEMVRHAAMKLGARGIRVNTISPGTVITPMQPADDPEARVAAVATCLGRAAFPDDVAGVYVFLASDDARYVTATDVRVDGGWLDGFTEAHLAAVLAGVDGAASSTESPAQVTDDAVPEVGYQPLAGRTDTP